MIIKSYEIQNNLTNFLKYKLFLLYGENNGLRKDIKESIRKAVDQKGTTTELLSLYENDIIDNKENFYNSIYSGSLFSDKKIITINSGTDNILNLIKDTVDKFPENVFLIVYAGVLEKKSKLRSFFETNTKTLCIPCYPDNEKDLEIIAKKELNKNNIVLSRESINLLIEKSNNDRSNLRNEVEKIKLFTLNNKNIKIDEIKSIINFSGEIKSDSFVNECLCGNILQYKKIISELYTSTVNEILLLRILSSKVHRLLKIKEQENKSNNLDNLINTSKPAIFWKEKLLVKKQLSIWNIFDLKKIIDDINNTELLCKKNPQISNSIFFNFFSAICKKANNFS